MRPPEQRHNCSGNHRRREGRTSSDLHSSLRKKLVYITQKQDDLSAHAHERSNNEVFIQIPHSPPFEASYSQDSSPFFYIANRESLFAVNTVTMEMLPPLYLGGASFYYIVGVHNGVITLMDQGKKWQLISAQLPEGYYDITTFYDEEKAERHRTGWKIKEFFGNLFRKSPSPEQTEVDNNANVIQPEKEQGSATMEKLADSMYLAFKSSVKMSDNFNGEATEFSSKFFNEFTFKQLRGSGGSGCVFEVSSKSDKCAYAVKRIAVAVEELDNAQEEVFTMAQFEHPGFVKYSCIWVEKPPKGWQRQMRFEDGGGSGGEKLVGDCYWSNSYQLRADFENLKELESSRNFRDDDVFIYIQMKLYKKSLADWLVENQTDSSRPISLVSSWFKQLVSAVWYLHDNDIIHSDLKPSNILIDNMNRLVLCTLGKVMKRKIGFEDESTSSRQKNCSLLYMSPEQSSILPRFTFKTDIFALGLILAEMSVVIRNDEERYELFDAYREGEPPNHIFDDEETAEFVAWLADKSSRKRPTCSEILIHPFLRSDG
ncbi:hypothetical protein PENTCL1PPCAC_8520 [Pristionchus entomophagus]|uniref:Protein kinase domain-containing protein n=1 Tax=Pristionchus entomophagus TaxID=358040 RepID=A0AAV5STD6_9BILA|nr:hypothetical protein PENTCL1PPCAC_8520 [Pristionchus entomophagus]